MSRPRDIQYAKFSAYGFLKNLRFFEPFLILYLRDIGLDYLSIGTLYAVREITVNLLEIPTGVVADALGRRRTMVASFVAYIGSFVLFFVAHGFWIVLGAMVLFAGGDALRTGTHKAMIMSYLRATGRADQKSRYYGRTRSWSQIGSAVSALGGAAIVFFAAGYRRVFVFSIVPYILDLLLIVSYPRSLDGARRPVGIGEVAESFKRTVRAAWIAARKPRLPRLLAGASISGGLYQASKDFLQPILVALALAMPFLAGYADERRSAVVVGIVYAVLYVATSAASRKGADVAAALGGERRTMNGQLVVAGVCVLGAGALQLARVPWAAAALFVGVYLIHNLRRPVVVSLVSDCVTDDVQATAMSVESQLKTGFAAVFAFLIGLGADLVDGEVGAGLVVLGVLFLLLLPLVWIRRRDAEVLGCSVD